MNAGSGHGYTVRAMKRLLAALCFVLAPLVAAATGETVAPADARAIRSVIEAQIEAFRADDGPRAFGYATRGIRATFGTPEQFIHMVRTSYAVVYRPRSVAFEPPARVADEVLQPVRMTDAEGRAWLAVYPMQRGEDGGWQINGCRLARLPGQGI